MPPCPERTERKREKPIGYTFCEALPLTGRLRVFLAAGCEPGSFAFLLRKEVIQPHLPVRLPCYDFTPLTRRTLGTARLDVVPAFLRFVTGGPGRVPSFACWQQPAGVALVEELNLTLHSTS